MYLGYWRVGRWRSASSRFISSCRARPFPAMERVVTVVMTHIAGTIGQERSQRALVMKVQSG